MIEDEIYRTSSQYRYWSYTRTSLAELRRTTNQLASDRVRAAVRRSRLAKFGRKAAEEGHNDGNEADAEIDTLTVDEELKIVRWGCSKIVEMGEAMTPRIPMNIVVRPNFAPNI
jgi:cyclin H